MDDMKIQELINKANEKYEAYYKKAEEIGIEPSSWDMVSVLKEAVQMIRELRDEIFSVNAETEAIRAVKDRFKELYVEAVVDKALKEETSDGSVFYKNGEKL